MPVDFMGDAILVESSRSGAVKCCVRLGGTSELRSGQPTVSMYL